MQSRISLSLPGGFGRWLGQLTGERPARLFSASILTIFFTALLVASVVFRAAEGANDLVIKQQRSIASHAMQAAVERLPHNQLNVATWDDAIRNIRQQFNLDWVTSNFGRWMSDYFGHDRTYLIDENNRVRYSFIEGIEEAELRDLTDPNLLRLVRELRANIAAGGLDQYEADTAPLPRTGDQLQIDGRPALASVTPIVSDTGNIVQDRGSEYLIVSVRYCDAAFAFQLAHDHQLQSARFSVSGKIRPGELSFAVTNAAGVAVGYLLWSPPLPGWDILAGMLPILVLGLFSVGVTGTFLIFSLRSLYGELLQSETHSKHLAHHDPLTGLPNRAFFDERLDETLRERSSPPPALLFLDLDRFKQVNDTLGHPAGDELIQQCARRLEGLIKPGEFMARMGGDEFSVILTEDADPKRIEKLCADIIGGVSTPFWVRGVQVLVGISIGVAWPKESDDPIDLARKADTALYRAKSSGRGRYEFFTEEMSETLREKRMLEVDLRLALQSGAGLEVVYQPVYSADGLNLKGVEALARWKNSRLGPISPVVFVALAEECGLIEALGRWVLREACTVAQITGVGTLAVNASPAQFLNSNFAATVLATLEETGFPASRLEIEITESTLLDEAGHAEKGMRTLREAGVGIVLDDFGTGYSSLAYLMKHKVDRVKIDRSFTCLLGDGAPATSVVLAIISMAHALDILVTAEGVETHEQQAVLKLLGCDDLQGFYLSKPLPATQLATLVFEATEAA